MFFPSKYYKLNLSLMPQMYNYYYFVLITSYCFM